MPIFIFEKPSAKCFFFVLAEYQGMVATFKLLGQSFKKVRGK